MAAETESLDEVVDELVGRHGGVRPAEQGEGDSFVAAFARPSDTSLARPPSKLALRERPLRLRIGVHTSEVQVRGTENYIGRSRTELAAALAKRQFGGR